MYVTYRSQSLKLLCETQVSNLLRTAWCGCRFFLQSSKRHTWSHLFNQLFLALCGISLVVIITCTPTGSFWTGSTPLVHTMAPDVVFSTFTLLFSYLSNRKLQGVQQDSLLTFELIKATQTNPAVTVMLHRKEEHGLNLMDFSLPSPCLMFISCITHFTAGVKQIAFLLHGQCASFPLAQI